MNAKQQQQLLEARPLVLLLKPPDLQLNEYKVPDSPGAVCLFLISTWHHMRLLLLNAGVLLSAKRHSQTASSSAPPSGQPICLPVHQRLPIVCDIKREAAMKKRMVLHTKHEET